MTAGFWHSQLDRIARQRFDQRSFHAFAEGMHSDARGQIFNLRAGERLPLWTDQWPDHLFIVLMISGDVDAAFVSEYRARTSSATGTMSRPSTAQQSLQRSGVRLACVRAGAWRSEQYSRRQTSRSSYVERSAVVNSCASSSSERIVQEINAARVASCKVARGSDSQDYQ